MRRKAARLMEKGVGVEEKQSMMETLLRDELRKHDNNRQKRKK